MADKLVIRGAREHNLKNVSLELPRDRLIVFTGLSGSGKSSLAFDTIYAEGQLTLLRSALVRTSTLASWARDLDLGSFVLVGRGEARGGGRDREPLLASTFEAIVGAVYLDRGFRAARQLVQRFAAQDVARLADRPVLDAKSRLQQVSQALYAVTPTYEVLDVSGLGHSPIFTVQVTAGGGIQTTAEGRSKQIAQQTAAAEALALLEAEFGPPDVEPDSR